MYLWKKTIFHVFQYKNEHATHMFIEQPYTEKDI
jgi:hypothetical protein